MNDKSNSNFLNQLLAEEYKNYQIINGLPCLYPNSSEELALWNQKIVSYINEEEIQIKHLQFRINNHKSGLTKKRLNETLQARVFNLKQIKKLLHGFFTEDKAQTVFSTQQIHSYFDNIFRDWSWGLDELDSYVAKLENQDFENKTVLILGAGAGGLGHLLASKYPSCRFVEIEHNPLLAIVNHQLSSGKTIKLSETSAYPKSLDKVCEKRELGSSNKTENKAVVLASFPDLPFKENSFDCIIAPWFLDILDIPFENALYCAKEFLKTDGVFHFCGPSNIHKKQISEQYCHQEIVEVFNEFFNHVEETQEELPYLNSPLNSQKRIETISFITASGSSSTDIDWSLTQNNSDLSFTPEFEQYKTMAIVKAQILSHINGDINNEALAKILVEKFGLSEAESIPYAKKFLDKIKFEY